MSYQTELVPNLQKMVNHKTALKNKLVESGATVPDAASLEDMVQLVGSGSAADDSVTVTAATLFNGVTARNAAGELITGTALSEQTDAGLYDVRSGKKYYDHTGTLREGLLAVTEPEDVAAMQDQIETLTGQVETLTTENAELEANYNYASNQYMSLYQNIAQVTAQAKNVEQGYKFLNSFGALEDGTLVPGLTWEKIEIPEFILYCFSSGSTASPVRKSYTLTKEPKVIYVGLKYGGTGAPYDVPGRYIKVNDVIDTTTASGYTTFGQSYARWTLTPTINGNILSLNIVQTVYGGNLNLPLNGNIIYGY